jgi:hypothetical protein
MMRILVGRIFVREKLVLRILTTIPTWKIWELASCSMAPRRLLVGSSVRGKFSIVRRYVVYYYYHPPAGLTYTPN